MAYHHDECLVYYICIVYQTGETALMIASLRGFTDVAKFLVDQKAGLDIQNDVSICCAYVNMYVRLSICEFFIYVCFYVCMYVCM